MQPFSASQRNESAYAETVTLFTQVRRHHVKASLKNGSADLFGSASLFVGSRTVQHYVDHDKAQLIIGTDRWSYVEVAQRTGLPPGRAARLVSTLAAQHNAVSIKDFYKTSSPASVATDNFGECAFLFLLRVFDSQGLDVMAWARRGPLWRKNGE